MSSPDIPNEPCDEPPPYSPAVPQQSSSLPDPQPPSHSSSATTNHAAVRAAQPNGGLPRKGPSLFQTTPEANSSYPSLGATSTEMLNDCAHAVVTPSVPPPPHINGAQSFNFEHAVPKYSYAFKYHNTSCGPGNFDNIGFLNFLEGRMTPAEFEKRQYRMNEIMDTSVLGCMWEWPGILLVIGGILGYLFHRGMTLDRYLILLCPIVIAVLFSSCVSISKEQSIENELKAISQEFNDLDNRRGINWRYCADKSNVQGHHGTHHVRGYFIYLEQF